MSALVRFISTYGLVVVFVGCIAEGETAAMAGGFLAHQGVLSPAATFLAAFLGATLGDVGFFFAGRKLGDTGLVRRRLDAPGFARARAVLQRHPHLFVLSNRFVYGLRTVGGLASGLSGIPVPTFLVLNAVSAFVWALLFTAIGWTFGIAAEQTIRGFFAAHHGFVVAGVAILLAAGTAGGLLLRKRRRSRG